MIEGRPARYIEARRSEGTRLLRHSVSRTEVCTGSQTPPSPRPGLPARDRQSAPPRTSSQDPARTPYARDIFFGALAWSLGQGETAHRRALEACQVKEVMPPDVVTTTPDTPLSEAASLMSERKLGCLPVPQGDTLVGILTEGDFLALRARPPD
jgi:hypothetical protein